MDDLGDYFARYEALAAISAEMLACAQRGELQTLADLGDKYVRAVDALHDAAPTRALNAPERERKYQILAGILREDAAIRDLCNPGLARLARLFAGRPAVAIKRFCAVGRG
ncbi:flagellar protein FliT [Paraburkholderia youngii]|uniref:flagellar protein FliT n=1 Tax=Paraburkholderia youngii TaxID=2782701 RepID=UPI003D1B4AE6